MNLVDRITLGVKIGVKRHLLSFISLSIGILALEWKALEPLIKLAVNIKIQGVGYYIAMAIVAMVISGLINRARAKLTIRIRSTNTSVEVTFGNIFPQEGHKVIPVNEFFDSELGDLVSSKSLHGQFIQQILSGRSSMLDDLVDGHASTTPHKHVPDKRGRTRKFPIGTTLVHESTPDKYYLVALSRTDIQTLKAKADISDMWQALCGLWDVVRTTAGGGTVNVPLIGGGLSGVGLPPQQLLQLLMMSILDAAKVQEITQKVRIVLHDSVFEDVDLISIRKDWG